MAGVHQSISDDSDSGLINSIDVSKRNENAPSSYFLTEFNNSSKKSSDNQQGAKSSGRYFSEEPSFSGRKVFVNVSVHGADRKTEIAVTSPFPSRKKVDSSTQSDRNIVGQEECSAKERKKWARPPVVGQAASNRDLPQQCTINAQTSSDSEFDQTKDDIPTTPDHMECQRVPSPGSVSSLTSRPLEWDSSADVGYNNIFATDSNNQRLSTLEKLALVQGTAIIFKRSDPEGTTENTKINPNIKISHPIAESTPKTADQKSDSESDNQGRCKNSKERKVHPLFPEVIVKTVGVPSDGGLSPDLPCRSELITNKKTSVSNPTDFESLKKLSCSLEEMGLRNNGGEQAGTFPRSHSQSNIAEENNVKMPVQRVVDSGKSRSSSSVSTVVNKRNSSRSNSTYLKGKYEGSSNHGFNENQGDCPNHALESNQHVESTSRHTSPQGTDQFNTLESGPLTGEARVNSFEYLPGHMYENSVAKVDSDSSSQRSHRAWNNIGRHSTLKDDVERGANLMAEFIRSSKAGDDDALKKQLVKRVVEKLINAEYPDDESLKSFRLSSIRGNNMMIESRGQISGESSMEKSDNNQAAQHNGYKANNKCVGTGISTSLSGYTESSEWNSATESSKKSTSDCLMPNVQGKSLRKADKMTQFSSRSDFKSSTGVHPSEKVEPTKMKNGVKFKRKESDTEMVMFLQREKKNQLHWIKSEIDHLSNLKSLLEKHETLKKNLAHLKENRKNLEIPLKAYSENLDKRRKNKHKKDQMVSKSERYLDAKNGHSNDSGSSCAKDNGWTSHHYETEDEFRTIKENIKPRMTSMRRVPAKSISDPLPSSTSYTIIFPNKSAENMKRKTRGEEDNIMLSVGELKTAIDEIVERHRKPSPIPNFLQPALKDCLKNGRPDYVKKAESRRQILSELVQLRQERQGSKQEIIAAANADMPGPPPPLAVKRVFSQTNLRKQTERKYKQLSEVRNKKADLKRKEEYRTNRLMAEIFTKKLQTRALKGDVNLSNSVCVTDPSK